MYGGLPPAVLSQRAPDFLIGQLAACLSTAYGYVRAQHATPFSALPLEFVVAVCKMAAYEILLAIGFNPEAEGDTNYKARKEEAIAWLRDVGKGHAIMAVVEDATPATSEGAPECSTSTPRGW